MNDRGNQGVDETLVRVVLRPIGSPLTIGLAGLGIASLVESGFTLSWISVADAREVGAILIAVPFLLQLLACVFSYLARDGSVGAAVGVLSSTWLAVGVVHLLAPGTGRSGALGLLLAASACVIGLSAVSVAQVNRLVAFVFALTALRFAFDAAYDLGGPHAWTRAGAIDGLVVCATIAYAVLALELEGQQRHSVLPTFRHGRGELETQPLPGEQLQMLSREPGVRSAS